LHAATALVVIAGWISSAINSLQEEIAHEKEARAQEEESQVESSRAHRQAIKRDIMEREGILTSTALHSQIISQIERLLTRYNGRGLGTKIPRVGYQKQIGFNNGREWELCF
jgi:hypothetical protein